MHAARHAYSVQDYLGLDDHVDVKLEFWNGEIFAMAGASSAHIRICANLMRILGNGLHGTPCEPLGADQRVALADDVYVYPDVTVACDAQWDNHALRNPRVLFEVLSPSTEEVDRLQKLPAYCRLDSVHEVVLIHQDRTQLEYWTRSGNAWSMATIQEGSVVVAGVEMTMAEVYDRVPFNVA